MSVFKQIGGGNHVVEPFEVNANHSFAWLSGSATDTNGQSSPTSSLSGSGFSINLANEPPINYPVGTTQALGGITDGGFYSYPLFNSVKKYFYVGEDGSPFSGKYNDLDGNADQGAGHYSFNTVGGTDVTAGADTNAELKAALSLLIHKSSLVRHQSVEPTIDRSTNYDAVTVDDVVTYKISDRRWYKYKITSVDSDNPSPKQPDGTDMDDRYRFGIELIDSDTYDGTGAFNYTAGHADNPLATFKFTGPGGDVYEFYPSGSMFVWNVGSNYTGEGIKPDTFKIELAGSSINIQDDGTGKLKLNKTGSVVGNISYSHGIAAVQRNITASATSFMSADGISIRDDKVVTSTFQSIVNIYEHTVTCKIQPTEYNVTVNPSAFTTVNAYDALGVGNYNNYMDSGSVSPYVTTLGLYNDVNELLAVAKLSKPITRMKYSDQTFVIKFDE